MKNQFNICLLFVLILFSSLNADIRLAGIFGSNMVLQRDMPIAVWGQASPEQIVTVVFVDQKVKTISDKQGRWRLLLSPVAAGGPYKMAVSGDNTIELDNILVGEVWLCSGQSNMGWPVRQSLNAEVEIAAAQYPHIRIFQTPRSFGAEPDSDIKGTWRACSPDTIAEFSAVAYFFGRELHNTLNVPVGLIHSSWGGSPVEAWLSECGFISSGTAHKSVLDHWEYLGKIKDNQQEQHDLKMAEWQEQRQKARLNNEPEPRAPNPPPALRDWFRPNRLYNGMIHGIIPYTIRGVIWYQGEANARKPWEYNYTFPALIEDWRNQWNDPKMPFLYVQLANLEGRTGWPEIRQIQLESLRIPNTAMAVAIDIGDPHDVHPANKQEVGYRLSLAAKAKVYGYDIEFSGPLFQKFTIEDSRIRIYFDHAETGLVIRNGPLRGFEVAGHDQKFYPAKAIVENNTVLVSSERVLNPKEVRYGWLPNPEECNLYNGAGLPASPFTTAAYLDEH